MLMIDPFDEIEKEEPPKSVRIKVLYEALSDIFKIILILIFLLVILFLILFVIVPEKGIMLQSFESNEKNISNLFIANHLCFELQNIKKINEMDIENPGIQSRSGGNIPSIKLPASSLDYSIAGLGNLGAGGTSISIGHLMMALKQFIGCSSPKITGSIHVLRSELRIIAILEDPNISGGIMAWEIERDISNKSSPEGDIPLMIEDLAFQIVNSINNENKNIISNEYPQTWEALKYSTMSRKAYINYIAAGNANQLNESRDFALDAKKSEPNYSNIKTLFSILGYSYLEKNNNKEAEHLFRNATELDSTYSYAWDGLGLALLRQKNYQESIHALDKIDLEERSANSWYNRGLALYSMGEFNDSIKAYDEAIKMDPANADTWFNKGLSILGENKNINDAVRAFDEVTKLSPNDEYAWYSKGLALYQIESYNESNQAYDRAIKLNGSYKEAWYNKGLSLAMDDRFNESIQALDEAIKLDQNDTDAWESKSKVLSAMGNCNGSIYAHNKALELYPQD
jgi:tetratricopeptide (TPR) repeat protein